MSEIESENQFIWKFILRILLTPITFIQILLRRKQFRDLFDPFFNLLKFIFEPKFTITIIIVNIIMFFVSIIFFSPDLFLNLANVPSYLIEFKLYSLITSGFLHGSLTHLIGNIALIFIFGRVVERKLGSLKTAVIFFGALIISNIFASVIHLFIIGDNIPGIGASGALMGLVSAAILLDPFYLLYELILPIPVMIAGWATIYADISGVINPVEDGIGHFAHIGGFLSIAILTFLLNMENKQEMKKGFVINMISLVIGVVIFVVVT